MTAAAVAGEPEQRGFIAETAGEVQTDRHSFHRNSFRGPVERYRHCRLSGEVAYAGVTSGHPGVLRCGVVWLKFQSIIIRTDIVATARR